MAAKRATWSLFIMITSKLITGLIIQVWRRLAIVKAFAVQSTLDLSLHVSRFVEETVKMGRNGGYSTGAITLDGLLCCSQKTHPRAWDKPLNRSFGWLSELHQAHQFGAQKLHGFSGDFTNCGVSLSVNCPARIQAHGSGQQH